MKKIIVLSLFLFVLSALAGCGGKEEENPKSDVIKRKAALTETRDKLKSDVAALKKEDAALRRTEKNGNIQNLTVTVKVNRKDSNRKDWDYGEKPDIYGLLTLSSGDAIAIPLTKNSFTAKGYAEDIELNKGDTVYVFLRDKDVDGYQVIENEFFVYNGRKRFSQRLKNSRLYFNITRKKIK
jgi:predicted small lipoprotein YifL